MKTTKTQITALRSGIWNQFPAWIPGTRQGSNSVDVAAVWNAVTAENPESMTIRLLGIEIALTANWSSSRKSVSYTGRFPKQHLHLIGLTAAKKEEGFISICDANWIRVSNGKNAEVFLCPSLIEIN